jgi:beta-galactosidase
MVGVAVAAILPASAGAEGSDGQTANPRPMGGPASSGYSQPFNENWRFFHGDASGADAVEFDDSAWRTLDVPHDWSIEDRPASTNEASDAVWASTSDPLRTGPFDMYKSAGEGATGWTVGGVGWYRKTFTQAQLPPGGNAELRFEGVYMNCDVWANGAHLGNHPYGYTEFAFDITPHLKDGRNTVSVRVNNAGRNSRWYSGSGIFRKVWLDVTGDLRIPAYGVFVTTGDVAQDAAVVNVAVTLESGSSADRQASVRARLLDDRGVAAGEAQQTLSVPAGANESTTCVVRLSNPRLWSPDHPQLYRAEVTVEADGKVADSTALQIGIRKLDIDAAQGLRINGQSYKLHGGCVHHDNGPLGSACIPRAEERRVENLKANGYNAIRTSHNPPSPAFLDACDRLGMMVLDEAFDCWQAAKNPDDYHLYFDDWWQRDLGSMVLRDRNHPSVVLWSIGNEVKERAEPQGIEIGKRLAAYVHQLDPTRKVTAAITGPYDHPGQTWKDMQPAFTYLDVGGYNYQMSDYEKDHVTYPDRVMVGTESYPSAVFQNWEAIERDSWVIGDFVWTAMDYMGESGVGKASLSRAQQASRFGGGGGPNGYPWFDAFCGDIDLIGNKKPQSYFRDVVWRRSKVEMAVQRPIPEGYVERASGWGWSDELRSWTWPGFEGSPLTVRVYTRGDKVSLLLNGKEVGAKQLTPADALKAEFTVPYASGELKAVAYQGGQEIGNIAFATVGKAQKLVLTPDRPKMKASRDDLSYVMVKVVDDKGRLVPDAVVPVSFSLKGVGELAAVGSGNPREVASFRQPHRNTFHGMCVAVVRPAGSFGAIELRADSPGLEAATTQLEVSRAS